MQVSGPVRMEESPATSLLQNHLSQSMVKMGAL